MRSSSIVALYPGSFDPITDGHRDIIARASKLFGTLVIGILANPGKQPLFSLAERVEMIESQVGDLPNVSVETFDGLLVQFAVRLGAQTILRGLRDMADFEIERQMAQLNRQMAPEIDTVFLAASGANAAISSRFVKEIASLGGDVSAFVPHAVAKKLKQKFGAR